MEVAITKRLVLISFLFIFIALSLISCTDDNAIIASKEYKVSYNNPYHSLYEELKPSYRVGEQVDVKINSCTDTGYLLLANNKRVSEVYHSNDLGYYWQFSFTMPENDVILEFKTYDGFLQYPNESTLIEAYILAHPDIKSARIIDYYGEYEGGAIVAAIKALGGEGASKINEAIDGFDLRYKDAAEAILVFLNSSFYSLKEAYESGYLTNESMQDIERKHKEYYSELYYNN